MVCHPFVSVVGRDPALPLIGDFVPSAFAGRAAQTCLPQSGNPKLEASDGKKQGLHAGHLGRMDSGESGDISVSISRVFGGCSPRAMLALAVWMAQSAVYP